MTENLGWWEFPFVTTIMYLHNRSTCKMLENSHKMSNVLSVFTLVSFVLLHLKQALYTEKTFASSQNHHYLNTFTNRHTTLHFHYSNRSVMRSPQRCVQIHTKTIVCSQSSTQPHGWLQFASLMSLTHSSAFTRCVFLSTSGPKLPSLCTRSSTAVHRLILARSLFIRCQPFKSPATSLFLQRPPHSASGSLFHCWQPCIFGCWPSGVELWQPSALDSRCSCSLSLDWSDILCLHTVHSGPSSVLNT